MRVQLNVNNNGFVRQTGSINPIDVFGANAPDGDYTFGRVGVQDIEWGANKRGTETQYFIVANTDPNFTEYVDIFGNTVRDFTITGLRYERLENGQRVEIATMSFAPISFEGLEVGTYFELGNLILDRIENDGFIFNGSNARDIYDPILSLNFRTNATFNMGNGDDLVDTANDASDLVYGGFGHDTIETDRGSDEVHAGPGNDRIKTFENTERDSSLVFGGTGDDLVEMGHGDDTAYGQGGADDIYGNGGTDLLIGGGGEDNVFGGNGDDRIFGQADDDRLRGELGDDLVRGGDGHDFIRGNDGNDRLIGGNGDDDIRGDPGNDRLYGQGGENTLSGGDGDDALYGGALADILDGGADNDLLRGEGGDDILTGGSGADKFQMRQGAGDDIIIDFESGIDMLIFKGVNGVSSEADLTMVQTADGVEITYGVDAYTVLLIGLDVSDLASGDFAFA